ncbi:MAG: hypothetical protein AAB037_03220 [Chloroflexota bacterium]
MTTYSLPQGQPEDSPRSEAGLGQLRYVPLPRPEEVQGWLRLAYEAGIAAGVQAAEEKQ